MSGGGDPDYGEQHVFSGIAKYTRLPNLTGSLSFFHICHHSISKKVGSFVSGPESLKTPPKAQVVGVPSVRCHIS